jgi:hypothetical protein
MKKFYQGERTIADLAEATVTNSRLHSIDSTAGAS